MKSLRWYPRAWRVRYGSELAALLEHFDESERSSWATRLDLARGGLGERLRILAPGRLPRDEQAREGSLLVLYAWVLFMVGGFAVEKASEHWQAVTPLAKRSLPSRAFDVLYGAAGIGSALVLAGVALSLPAIVRLLRDGGWTEIRRPLLRAALLSLLAVAVTAGLSRWAHSLTPLQRNGGDALYSSAFVAWFVLAVSSLFAWATAAAGVARRLTLSPSTLRLEAALAAAVSLAMAVMTVATALWWASLANVAPWFFSGTPIGSHGSAVEPNIIVASLIVLSATALGAVGAARAARGGLWRS